MFARNCYLIYVDNQTDTNRGVLATSRETSFILRLLILRSKLERFLNEHFYHRRHRASITLRHIVDVIIQARFQVHRESLALPLPLFLSVSPRHVNTSVYVVIHHCNVWARYLQTF